MIRLTVPRWAPVGGLGSTLLLDRSAEEHVCASRALWAQVHLPPCVPQKLCSPAPAPPLGPGPPPSSIPEFGQVSSNGFESSASLPHKAGGRSVLTMFSYFLYSFFILFFFKFCLCIYLFISVKYLLPSNSCGPQTHDPRSRLSQSIEPPGCT